MINRNKYMRKILLFVLGAALCACTSKNPNDIVVNVEVENMTVSNVGLLIDRSTSFIIPLDKHGKGRLVITGLENIYPRVIYGQAAQLIFIGRGEEVTLRFDGRKFKDGIRVEGRNVEANEYLQSTTPSAFNAYDLPWEKFCAEINRLADDAVHLMKARKLEQTCPDFAKVEEARLRYLYAQPMLLYTMGYRMMGDPDYVPGKEVYDAVGKMVVEREELADVDAYRDYIHFAIPMVLEGQGSKFDGPYARTVATMRYVADNFTNEKVKQTMLRLLAIEYMQSNGVRNTAELQNIANTYITDPQMLREYKEELESHNLTAIGHPSPDFTATDLTGKSYSLADFRGKYLYIDMWATWCAPCKAELPYFRELVKKFEGRNITFLGLSVDKDKAAWEKMAESGQLAGVQLLLGSGSRFQSDYNIEGIPHFILLDKEGKIVNADMLRPSSEDTERLLNELEGI